MTLPEGRGADENKIIGETKMCIISLQPTNPEQTFSFF